MERNLRQLASNVFDLLIIGGGIYGVSVARDAALRGLHVALVEKGDFGHATSFNSLKIIHGGFRYLQHLDVPRMRRSIFERSALMRIAPHLTHPLPFLMPTYGQGFQGKWIMRMALALNDLIGFDRNWSVDESKHLPNGRVISRAECLQLVPGLSEKGLTGGAIWYDCQLSNSERFIMAVLKGATSAGADVANYVEVTGFLRQGDDICGIKAVDRLSEDQVDIRSRFVVNASGPWFHEILGLPNGGFRSRSLPLSKAMNLVVNSPLVSKFAVGIPERKHFRDDQAMFHKGSRLFFMVPWRQYTFIGTTHTFYEGKVGEFRATEEDVEVFLAEINTAYPPAHLTMEDICFVYAGLLPRNEMNDKNPNVSLLKRPIIVDHQKDTGVRGLISIVGVKLTEARYVAEKAVDLVCQKLGQGRPPSRTAVTPVDGGEIDCLRMLLDPEATQTHFGLSGETIRHLGQTYGSSLDRVLKYLEEDETLGQPIASESPVIKAEVTHAVREEMAVTLSDVVRRRTELGTFECPGESSLETCAEIMAKELDWGEHRRQAELASLRSSYLAGFPVDRDVRRELEGVRTVGVGSV